MRRLPETLLGHVLRYGVAGLGATVLYLGAVAGLVEITGARPVPAAVAATVLVIVTSYVVNRAWVFSTDRSHASAFIRFLVASALSIVLNAGLMYLSVHVRGWSYVTGLALTATVVPPTNFVINYFWCFRPTATQAP
jgi:putative flippase GtrA